jgi:PleD family two-component response regulator
LPDNASVNSTQQVTSGARSTRRAVIVADGGGLSLQQQLTAHGYVTRTVAPAGALYTISEFAPDVVIMVIARASGDAEHETVALARKLRSETATYSLPIVFVWNEDEHALRAAAHYIGVDDYFSLATPWAEILARLDSLFWRVEADRRSAAVVHDQRLDIDNFMFMLDAVREDVRAGASGTLAVIYAVAPRGQEETFDKAARNRTLGEAQNFLKLNLRRVDAVAFYGPTTLLVYLPRMDARSAVAALSRLHREFLTEHPDRDIIAGLASFPTHGSDVEALIEKAEEAVQEARSGASAKRVVAYTLKAKPAVTVAPTEEKREPLTPKEATAAPAPAAPESKVSAGDTHQAVKEETAIPVADSASVPAGNIAAVAKVSDAAASADGAAQAAEAAARELERRASGAVMPRRLLLTISDAARMTQINSLIRSAGYEARAAFDGKQALHLLRIEQPDLLLLDFDLQGIDGVETVRRLRKQSGGRLTLPVVMLLSSEDEHAEREALELGVTSVLVAPYDPAELLANLRAAGQSD